MKRQVVEITCDNCGAGILRDEDHHQVQFQLGNKELTTDWCTTCHDALLRKLGINADELTCTTCGYQAKSERGLRQHKTKQSHD